MALRWFCSTLLGAAAACGGHSSQPGDSAGASTEDASADDPYDAAYGSRDGGGWTSDSSLGADSAQRDSQVGVPQDSSFVANPDADSPVTTCNADPDCDDHEVCTTDTCASLGTEIKVKHCEHKPAPVGTPCDDGQSCTVGDACTENGSCAGQPNPSCQPPPPAPLELCADGCASGTTSYPPVAPILTPALPATCSGGFEMNKPPKQVFTIPSTNPGGAAGGPLDIQIATYLAPDHIRITGTNADGSEYLLVETCGLQTYDYADPTDGCTRPPDDSIRQYTATVKPGTQRLTFDVTGACTPTYMRVLGLCDFTVTPFFVGCGFRTIP